MCVCVCVHVHACVCVCTLNFAYVCNLIHLSINSIASPGTPRPIGHSGIRQIEAQPQLPIDRNHPVVQQLCSAGYTEEESIDALEVYETRDRALKYLMSKELGDENESEGIFQTAARGRQDSTPLWRQSSGGARYVEQLDPP